MKSEERDLPLSDQAFWALVRRRRNHFFWTAFAWPVAGIVLMIFYSWILPDSFAPFAALGTWIAFWWWVGRRLTAMKCFQCGKQAFAHPYFFMRHAKCQRCGVASEG